MTAVALPGLAISAEHGQLTGQGLEGFYHSGKRLLSLCRLQVAGRDPLPVEARGVGADRTRFVGVLRGLGGPGPDPDLLVERERHAEGSERITLRSTSVRPLRLVVELTLGCDLADLGAVAAGRRVPPLRASVHGAGLQWSSPAGKVALTAEPPAADVVAASGLLRWEVEIPAGGRRSIALRLRAELRGAVRPVARGGTPVFADADASGDDPRAAALLRASLGDLNALLVREPGEAGEVHLAAGAPWRCGLAPAEALAAARMVLPLGTRLAAGTLRSLARTQVVRGPEQGRIPGPLRDAGPHLPPGSTSVEATLLFPALLSEAWRWGLDAAVVEELAPAAESCLGWLRREAERHAYVRDRETGGMARVETQAHAYRAALLGAGLLDGINRPGSEELRGWSVEFVDRFRTEFWYDDRGGGRPPAALDTVGRPVPHLGSAVTHLLDTGLGPAGEQAPSLLDPARTGQLARLLGTPVMDSGWGLRSLGAKEHGYSPFGHRGGAVRVHETAIAVTGLAAAGYEKQSHALLRGLLAAAEHFEYRLPEMFAGEQRGEGSRPWPHPAACRPAAVAAAAGVHVVAGLVGIRPDVPEGSVALRPVRGAPLGELGLTGLGVAGESFSARVTRLGLAMVEEAPERLQLRA
ncbi:glycogen debranching N-terminal domain-containing protein [Streptomyces sp. NPDC001054]